MTKDYTMYLADAFTDRPYTGNPAGIVLNDGSLEANQMLKIAAELRMSETAFVESLDREEYKVRFFTPVEEVDLCGHATIATFYILAKKGYIHGINQGIKTVYQHTGAGKLAVHLHYVRGRIHHVMMEQAKGEDFGPVEDINGLAEAMGIGTEDFGLPDGDGVPRKVSTGLKDMMVPLRSRDVLEKVTLDKEKTIALSRSEDAMSIHAFTVEDGIWYQRNFAPIVGIDEEAATGTSTGAMLYYLKEQGFIKDDELTAIQGLEMGRPSELYARIDEDGNVNVGGRAALAVEGVIHV